MGKQKNKNKGSSFQVSLPKGLPQRVTKRTKPSSKPQLNYKKHGSNNTTTNKNPFERPVKKYQRNNISSNINNNKVNTFKDKRIQNNEMDVVRRIVKERMKTNKKANLFNLSDNNESLRHRGRKITDISASEMNNANNEDSDDEYQGNDKFETELHFGGGEAGSSGVTDNRRLNRKIKLEERILKSKQMKDEKKQMAEKQISTFDNMDEDFSDLAALLNFRNNNAPTKTIDSASHLVTRSKHNDKEHDDDDDWDAQQKGFLISSKENKKVKALDRTKTPDEIAKEEKEKLEEMEIKRLKRMNGEFDNDDDLSDVSSVHNDSDDEEEDDDISHGSDEDSSEEEDEDNKEKKEMNLEIGSEVMVKYHAKEQELFPQEEVWYPATITKINKQHYSVKYTSDGEIEENIHINNMKQDTTTLETNPKEKNTNQKEQLLKLKQKKAITKARKQIPFTFTSDQIPTTIDYLHEELIGVYAANPQDVIIILERIYKSTNIKIHPENNEKYHNFYDVLLRRFILVGDAILDEQTHQDDDDDDSNVHRWNQLNYILKLLYDISQDCPHNAMSIWNRRLRIFTRTFLKKCHDLSMTSDSSISAWPSYGTILLLKSIGHIFPTTDFRHVIITPTILLLGQYISHSPIRSMHDLYLSFHVCGLVLQFNVDTNRIIPELYSYLSSILWLYYYKFYNDKKEKITFVLPNIKASISYLKLDTDDTTTILDQSIEKLSYQNYNNESSMSKAMLTSTLLLIQSCADNQKYVTTHQSNYELFADLYKSLVLLSNTASTTKKDSNDDMNTSSIHSLVLDTILKVSDARAPTIRYPLQRSLATTKSKSENNHTIIPEELIPRLDTMTSNKQQTPQNEIQQLKREYKQNQKSIQKQIRKDAKQIEIQRRAQTQNSNDHLKQKRLKNYGMLEDDQATMNQQVRTFGENSKGGGTGGIKDLMKRDGVRKRKQR